MYKCAALIIFIMRIILFMTCMLLKGGKMEGNPATLIKFAAEFGYRGYGPIYLTMLIYSECTTDEPFSV